MTQPLRKLAWDGVTRWIRKKFPKAPAITTQHLADWLSQGKEPQPWLLDVRKAEEFAISHLPQARHAPNVNAVLALGLPKHQPMVAYCSVGYRSARLVEQLQAQGFTQVHNLEGSLFQWVNEGRPVVREGQPVAVVHPYNSVWGLLLKPTVARSSLL
ncbi:MAG: rhodanese-like domain-containing protein [Leptolyngbyaceae cyanobacterium SM2_3_12]|nr:rhodanese-like domain-containing protein [Leptolyngbyaceae cyanobacterium SM2_3_12]